MALSKIQSESMNLADTFAFTGTVSGAGAMEPISTTDVTTPAQFVVFDNLSTDYDTFHCQFELHPANDGVQLGCQFLDSSGTVINDSDAYGQSVMYDGSTSTSDSTNAIPFTATTIGNDTYEGVRGFFNLLGRNYAVSTDTVPPTVAGIAHGHYQSNVWSGGPFVGGLNTEQIQTIRGFRLYVSSGNIERGKVYLFGVKNA